MKVETVEEYVARGGKITVLPPNEAVKFKTRVELKQEFYAMRQKYIYDLIQEEIRIEFEEMRRKHLQRKIERELEEVLSVEGD